MHLQFISDVPVHQAELAHQRLLLKINTSRATGGHDSPQAAGLYLYEIGTEDAGLTEYPLPYAELQYRPEDVAQTGFHEPVRDSARCLAGDRLRLSPDGF